MRLIYALFPLFYATTTLARSIFEDEFGNGITNEQLRQGSMTIEDVPNIILAMTNNLLSFVGYISLGIIIIGGLLYTFGGVNEEWKTTGKKSIEMALIGAIVSWSAWMLVNFWLDNI